MAGPYQSIALLPLDAQAQIRSSVQITSLSDVVLELVKNSLDANAEHITVRLDFLKGYCEVLDDGDGILRSEFETGGGLAHLYHTSKYSNRQHIYGRYGRFLASLSAVSLFSITSRHFSNTSVNSSTFKDGENVVTSMDIDDSEINGNSHGTKVVVHNLFGSMPVRVKHRFSQFSRQHVREKEFFKLRHSLVGVVLTISRPFSLDVRNDSYRYLHNGYGPSQQDPLSTSCDLEHVVSILFQAKLLEVASTTSWRQACAQSPGLSVQGFFCLERAPSTFGQFISLNHQPLSSTRYKTIFDQVNALFDLSTFGITAEEDNNVESIKHRPNIPRTVTKRVGGARKGVDKWPMFYIRIALEGVSQPVDSSIGPEVNKITTMISGSLCALITEFLQIHGFRTRQSTVPKPKRQVGLSASLKIPMRSVSNFDSWSRIKSGNSIPIDVLNGLPFSTQNQKNPSLACSTEPSEIECENEQGVAKEGAILWRHPRTRNVLSLDPRTGMVMPPQLSTPHSGLAETSHLRHFRKLSDVVDSLEEYVTSARIEPTIGSIIANHQSGMPGGLKSMSEECMYILHGNRDPYSTIPVLMEPAGSSIGKLDLKTADVLGQVDRKFVLASVVLGNGKTTLFLVDQHAADERVRVEDLLQQLCRNESALLPTPITFEVNALELSRFRQMHSYFAQWQIHYSVLPEQIRVSALPEMIIERCRLEPKLLIGLLRKEVWQEHLVSTDGANASHWLDRIGGCPQGILDILASRACRTAIMFNDDLALEQCRELIQRLAMCLFPFQCAHGRPSLTVIATYREVGSIDEMEEKNTSFAQGWQAWNS